MKENMLIKLLCSIPVILIVLYFIPVLGFILMLVRFIFVKKTGYKFSIMLIILGLVLMIPQALAEIFRIASFNTPFSELVLKVVNYDFYTKMMSYGKTLIIIGIISILVLFVVRKIMNKTKSVISEKINQYETKEAEIREKNDLKIKEKQEAAKNTHFITCPTCGASNVIQSNIGTCKYCRNPLEYKDK